MRVLAVLVILIATIFCPVVSESAAQTVEGDILRGQGAFAAGAGWYNLNTAKGNAINVQAMRNFNEEVRLNLENSMQRWKEKDTKRKLTAEEAKKRAQQRLKQIRENPTADDVRSGDALNMLTVVLTDPSVKQQDWYTKAVTLPENATVKDVVFFYYPNRSTSKDLKFEVAVSRLGKGVDWPLAFTADAFIDERMAYEESAGKVKANILKGKFEPKDLTSLTSSLDALLVEVNKTYANDKNGYLAKGKDFQSDLKAATKLFDGGVVDYAKELLAETEEHDAKTVGELVAFMLKYRLFFAPAESPRSIELYDTLFKVMDEQANKLGVKSIPIEDVPDIEVPSKSPMPKPIDYFTAGSSWTSDDQKRLSVTDRKGNTFRATFNLGNGKIEREITGKIQDDKISWGKRDVRVIKGGAGGDNYGTIKQEGNSFKIDFVWQDESGKGGTFVLRLAH